MFDLVEAGTWRWPDPLAVPSGDSPDHLQPEHLERLAAELSSQLVGEAMQQETWTRTWQPYLVRLVEVAKGCHWPSDSELLTAFLNGWEPGSRSRQMAYDRARRLWKQAGWAWPEEALQGSRGNGKAAADPQGVRAFTDDEIFELRARIRKSLLSPADLVAWDCLICFGLRPAELQGLQVSIQDGTLLAQVHRQKRSSKGSCGARTVPAIPPKGWTGDCEALLKRWDQFGLPHGMVSARSPGQVLTQQLRRLNRQARVTCELSPELTSYGLRHAFALRLGLELQLSIRESAELMGHSPQVHLSTYGRRLDQPKLQAKVAALLQKRASELIRF